MLHRTQKGLGLIGLGYGLAAALHLSAGINEKRANLIDGRTGTFHGKERDGIIKKLRKLGLVISYGYTAILHCQDFQAFQETVRHYTKTKD